MKIAIAQINPVIGDFSHNCSRIIRYSEKAKALNCDLIVFSELVIPGYPPRDLLEKPDFIQSNLEALQFVSETIRGIGVICGFVEKNPGDRGNPLFNAAALFEDGRMLHKVQKQLLPTYDVFDERRYFEPGKENRVIAYKGRKIGLTICEDAWNDQDIIQKRIYPIDPVALLVQQGADLLINLSASVYHAGKADFRVHMLGSIAGKYGVPLIYANQVGGNDSVLFDGASMAFDACGEKIAQAADFEEDLVAVDLNIPGSRELHPVSESLSASVLKALVTGTRDYVKKCGFSKAVVGLSGGIDSALTLAIAKMALGRENVSAVFMPSPYTSRDNYEDTAELCRRLDIELTTIPIDGIFREFTAVLSPGFNTDSPGIAEQNIQARIRGTLLMAISNMNGSLVLSTGNKSELAVGYCTLYGDMNGGLAVISDVPKTLVYDLSRYLNASSSVIPERILEKAPSAELKPGQTDQDDLPPYEILDAILKASIEDLMSFEDIVRTGFDPALVRDILSRIDRNEYKRSQAAPGLKVTSKAFGYGRRYPLAKRLNRVKPQA
jgi:NAD+ synthase (glutamine-hydrolysing)